MDVVKGIAIILVVMGHVGSIYGGDSSSRSFHILHDFIYSFHMPLFMFISGYLFSSSLMRDYKITALSKLIAYGIPYVVFSILYWVMKTLGGAFVNNAVSFKDLFLIPVFPLSFMWYLYALLIITEMSLVIGRRSKRTVLMVALVCRVIWEILTNISGFTDSRVNDLILTDFIKNYIWFALGFVYAGRIVDVLSRLKSPVKFGFSLIGIAVLIVVSTVGLTKTPFVRILWGLIGICITLCIGLQINKNSFLEYMGRNSMQIYLMHGIVISVLKIITTRFHVPMWGGYFPLLYGTVIASVIPLLIYAICQRVPALDFLFFPNKYYKAKKRYKEWRSI